MSSANDGKGVIENKEYTQTCSPYTRKYTSILRVENVYYNTHNTSYNTNMQYPQHTQPYDSILQFPPMPLISCTSPSYSPLLGAELQSYNVELVKCIEELKERRDDVARTILKEEEEKEKIQNDVRILNERLSRLNDSLSRKVAAKAEYDKTIRETEAAYVKILESSVSLLHVVKRESGNLVKKKQSTGIN